MPEQLLAILKLCLLALLYLFFLRVLRAVWVEVRGPGHRCAAAKPPAQGRPPQPRRKARPAPARSWSASAQHGGKRERRSYDVGHELTVGRAAGCQVTLDDTYVTQLHARVFVRDGQVYVEDLGSTNGTYLNGHR